jgi:AraC-like DNA-binding protein
VANARTSPRHIAGVTSSAQRVTARRGTIVQVTSRRAAEEHLRNLARLRRVRDRIDREYARPLDVDAPARGAHMSAGHLSRQFRHEVLASLRALAPTYDQLREALAADV